MRRAPPSGLILVLLALLSVDGATGPDKQLDSLFAAVAVKFGSF